MITKDKKHSHFWIESNKLYESYKTIRGLRYRFKCDFVADDNNCCSDDIIKQINYEHTR